MKTSLFYLALFNWCCLAILIFAFLPAPVTVVYFVGSFLLTLILKK